MPAGTIVVAQLNRNDVQRRTRISSNFFSAKWRGFKLRRRQCEARLKEIATGLRQTSPEPSPLAAAVEGNVQPQAKGIASRKERNARGAQGGSFNQTSAFLLGARRSRYTRDIHEPEFLIPRRVLEDGSHDTYSLPNFYDRRELNERRKRSIDRDRGRGRGR